MRPFHQTVWLSVACAWLAVGCSQPSEARTGAGAGPVVAVRTTPVLRMAVQRQVDLACTPLSPDQAKVSAEAAGIVRQVLVEIGREVRAGDPLVRLETSELTLALARAESALRQTRAQLGMHGPIAAGDHPPPDDEIGSVRNAIAGRDDARASSERAKTLAARGLLSPVDLQAAETRLKVSRGRLPVGSGHRARARRPCCRIAAPLTIPP